MVRHFLRDDDISPAEQKQILDLAFELKAAPYSKRPLEGPKTVALIFDKTSTRTRVSFSVGIGDLGGIPLVMQAGESQLGGKESIKDTARVLERMVSAIIWRTFEHTNLEEMARGTRVPVVNSLTDDFHPCQLLADLMTIREHKGDLLDVSVAFVGDGSSNMANSYLVACSMAGASIRLATPIYYQPLASALESANRFAAQTGGSVKVVTNPNEAVAEADVVVTDTWVSMGQEAEKAKRLKDFGTYRVDAEMMKLAKPDAIFMHCLPAYREYEVEAEVIDGPQSVIWDEAENRVHAQKALLNFLLTA